MANGKIDKREAESSVRKYFEQRSKLSIFSMEEFRIEEAHQEDDRWVVECSYYPSISSPSRTYNRVLLSNTGKIIKTESIP